MPPLTAIIGIKIPADSDLKKRFRYVSNRLNMQYAQLLEKWLTQEEATMQTSAQFQATGPDPRPPAPKASELNKLKDRITALEDLIKNLTESQANADPQPAAEASELNELKGITKTIVEGLIKSLIENRTYADPRPPTPKASEEISELKDMIKTLTESIQAIQQSPTQVTRDPIDRILELHAEGMSSRAIATTLEAEGIKTQKGLTQWNYSTIAKLIKRHKP